MSDIAGRVCPLNYRYGARAIAMAPLVPAQTLYVVGGLYGNLPALDAVEALAAQEMGPVTLCFNGDFNWFNSDSSGFQAINRRVLAHAAIQGNVEAELFTGSDAAGCGCGYPDDVDSATVERSNRIHARLKHTAQRAPDLQQALSRLPMFARYQVGECRVGVVHGDADSLAGWHFDGKYLAQAIPGPAFDPVLTHWLQNAFDQAEVDVFACSHTCQPALLAVEGTGDGYIVINNGAAGMPNFDGLRSGLFTRISVQASHHTPIYGARWGAIHVDALAVSYDHRQWEQDFLAQWPKGSDAYQSYFKRICGQTSFTVAQAQLAPK
jgi:hypothetical protein